MASVGRPHATGETITDLDQLRALVNLIDTIKEKYMDQKKQEYERRALECVQGLHGLMTEAKREGFNIEVYTHVNIDGEPRSRVAVLLR